MPEAVASATLTVTTPQGFSALFTIREPSAVKLFASLSDIETKLIEDGYKPQQSYKSSGGSFGSKPTYQPDFVPGAKCPTCLSPLIYAKKSDGTSFIKCSTAKWNKFEKKNTGCDFVDWDMKTDTKGQSTQTTVSEETYRAITEAQKKILLSFVSEGIIGEDEASKIDSLSFDDARKLIAVSKEFV